MELLRTPRLLLRHWEDADLPAFFDLYSRDEVMRWLGPHPRRVLASQEEARARLDGWQAYGQGLDPPLGLWAMVPTDAREPAPAGTILLLPLTDASGPAGLIEVGWHLHPQHQGQGLATEAAEAILTAAAQAGIDQVLALTDPDNVRSQAVAVRLGMHDEGLTSRWFGLTTRQYRKTIGPAPEP
jgi:RimJ/RimL family protein N-acetyltransferase